MKAKLAAAALVSAAAVVTGGCASGPPAAHGLVHLTQWQRSDVCVAAIAMAGGGSMYQRTAAGDAEPSAMHWLIMNWRPGNILPTDAYALAVATAIVFSPACQS